MNYGENWGADPRRQPTIADGDILQISEHGRIIGRVDYRSHWFCIVRQQYGGYALLVKHGGGEERIQLGHSTIAPVVLALLAMDADSRYLALRLLHHVNREAENRTEAQWRQAAAEKRIERKRVPGGSRDRALYRVSIIPRAAQ